MLEMATPAQTEALEKIAEHRRKASQPSPALTLDSYAASEEGLSVADHLMRFTNAPRLSRAEKIADDELTITRNTGDRIEAKIRKYSIEIDASARTLGHDCDDWRKGSGRKRICKHVAKLFLSLPQGQAEDLLTEMWVNRESWRFEDV